MRLADGRADLLPAQSLAEHVVGPALVEEDDRCADRGDDGDHRERVVPGGGVGIVRLLSKVGWDEYAGVQAGEDGGDEADRAEAGCREGPPPRSARVSPVASISASAVSAAGTATGRMLRLLRSWATATVQATIAMPSSAAGTDSRLLIVAARSQRSPDGRSVR